jgi:hypothetical protein
VTLTPTINDPGGVQSVAILGREAGTGAWYPVVTDTTDPFTFSYNTVGIPDGLYDIRVVVTDRAGNATTTDHLGIRLDNVAPRATDVQAVNGGGTAGRLDAGDVITFTWSEPMDAATILAGCGTSTAVTVRIDATDVLEVLDAGNAVVAGTRVTLGRDFVDTSGHFAGTMTCTGAQVRVTLGALGAGTVNTVATAGPLTWQSSTTARDLAGRAATGNQVVEAGTADVDF